MPQSRAQLVSSHPTLPNPYTPRYQAIRSPLPVPLRLQRALLSHPFLRISASLGPGRIFLSSSFLH
jgi:hypothetical protein